MTLVPADRTSPSIDSWSKAASTASKSPTVDPTDVDVEVGEDLTHHIEALGKGGDRRPELVHTTHGGEPDATGGPADDHRLTFERAFGNDHARKTFSLSEGPLASWANTSGPVPELTILPSGLQTLGRTT